MGDIQEKRIISVRLPQELVAWMAEFGAARRWDRTTVIQAALESFRDDAKRGVPEVPASVPAERERPAPARTAVPDFGPDVARASDPRWLRQQKLNEAKYGRRK